MSTAKENPCRKFQANFFNKSKCQNCFKPRELHLLTDQDLTQVRKKIRRLNDLKAFFCQSVKITKKKFLKERFYWSLIKL